MKSIPNTDEKTCSTREHINNQVGVVSYLPSWVKYNTDAPNEVLERIYIIDEEHDEMPVIKMSLLKAWKVNQIPEDGISFSELMRLFVPFYEYLKINMRERLKIRVATHGNDDGDRINLGMWTAAKNKRKEGEL